MINPNWLFLYHYILSVLFFIFIFLCICFLIYLFYFLLFIYFICLFILYFLEAYVIKSRLKMVFVQDFVDQSIRTVKRNAVVYSRDFTIRFARLYKQTTQMHEVYEKKKKEMPFWCILLLILQQRLVMSK